MREIAGILFLEIRRNLREPRVILFYLKTINIVSTSESLIATSKDKRGETIRVEGRKNF